MVKNFIINNLLCFLHSARDDYADEALFDVLYSFYSIEEIRSSKDSLADILKKDSAVRREPDRKRKELLDLIDYYEEFKSNNNNKDVFVSNTYKKMPPIGLEFIAPILTNLSEEIVKINNILPKIMDIRSEVSNTADTVRNLKSTIVSIESKIKNSNSHQVVKNGSTTPINKLINKFDKLTSRDDGNSNNSSSVIDRQSKNESANMTLMPQAALTPEIKVVDNSLSELAGCHGNSMSMSDSFSNLPVTALNYEPVSICNENMNDIVTDPTLQVDEHDIDNGWTLVQRSKRNSKPKNNNSKYKSDSIKLIRGSGQKCNNNLLKGVDKLVDIYVGRVELNTNEEVINSFIKDNFNISPVITELLKIKSDEFKSYKVKVKLSERDSLFDPSLWPNGVVINKYYNKHYRNY